MGQPGTRWFGRLRAWLRRRDSLFARMLLIQSSLALGLSLVYFTLYFVERNRAVASVMAERWAGPLALAAGLPSPPPEQHGEVLVQQHLPEGASEIPALTPRLRTLKAALEARGIVVQAVALERATRPSLVWLKVASPRGGPLWLGVTGPLVESHEFGRIALGLTLACGLVLLLSWHPARMMTRRLDRLRRRIRSGQVHGAEPPDLASTPEILEIERAYDELLDQVQRQASERALLLAGVSHDLRSPLGRIRMAAELLPDDPALAPRRASIVGNVLAADRLIESFLDLVRSSEMPLDELVDVADGARHVAAAFERPPDELHVCAPDVLELPQANQHLLERALFNLIDNALKHGQTPVTVRVSEQPGAVLIEVEDQGPGMPAQARQQMLQAFARGDSSRSKPGSGLGLAVVQQVTQRLQGELAFEGGPGRWTVRWRLPVSRSRQA
jgi:two-component system osmolarity sensor histidine kinase EnvZ